MANTAPYIAAWEMVVEGRKPSNEQEQKIFDVMHTKVDYFKDNFKIKMNMFITVVHFGVTELLRVMNTKN